MNAGAARTSTARDTMRVMTAAIAEFSCRPWAQLPDDAPHEELMDAILSSLEANARALGPAVTYDPELGRVDAIFQISGESLTASTAGIFAAAIFDDALEAAGLKQRTSGLAVVEGGDPDLLP